METPLYQYQPLQHSDSARILILHPSPNESDPIECTICHENLSDGSLCYEAVSYTWGNSGLTHIIHCNDAKQRLPVGRNCHAALRRLRLPKKYRKLWIDAVCINQEDLHERGHQVRIMRDVYDFASGVMVMLSDEIPDSRLLLDELVEIGELLTPGADITRAPPSEAIVLQLESLFEDPWFKRTWVLQEVYRKGLVTIVYGSTAIKSEALRYMYFGYKSMHGCAGMQVSRTQLPLPFLIMSEGENGYSTPQFALWSRLYESRKCLATNPRDRVLALKSLVGPRQSDMDHLVDYTQSVEQCFRRVATFLLPVVGMRILTATRHPHGLDMPSWVPDWSQTLPLQRYSFWYDTIHDDNPDAEFSPPRVRIFGGALRSSLYDESYISSELRVSGFQAGRIVECSKVFQFADLDDTDMQMRQIYNQYDNIRLYLDETSKIQRPKLPDHFSGEISDTISSHDGWCVNYFFTRACHDHLHGNPIVVRYNVTWLYNALQSCSIGLLEDGCLAIVPGAARHGDIVCMLAEAIAPCLLRPDQNGCWILVSGDCFLYDLDFEDQEPIDEYVDLNEDRLEEFILR